MLMFPPISSHYAVVACVLSVLLLPASSLSAHHANSAYDREKTISVSGTVTKWQFINPHAGIWLNVTDEAGDVHEWAGEFQSIQDLYRFFQWNQKTFQPSDEITIVGNPDRRPDRYSMWVSRVIVPDGSEIDVRNTPE
jgi:hypothetical protein